MTEEKYPKKVLGLNMFFALPDDFNGDLDDALLAFAMYRKSTGKKIEQNTGNNRTPMTQDELWDRFLQEFQNGKRCAGQVSFGDVTGE